MSRYRKRIYTDPTIVRNILKINKILSKNEKLLLREFCFAN